MEKLLAILLAIKHYAKDIHYNSKGKAFWGNHLLADKIGNDMDSFIDSINEQVYLGHHLLPPASANVLDMASELIPLIADEETMWKNLDKLLADGISFLDDIDSKGMFRGDNQLFDDIASNLQAKRGLLWRRIA